MTDAFLHRRVVEIQPTEVARVGGVLEAEIDAVGTIVDSRLERRQAAGRAHQFNLGHEVSRLAKMGREDRLGCAFSA